jgi:hypothetical protein
VEPAGQVGHVLPGAVVEACLDPRPRRAAGGDDPQPTRTGVLAAARARADQPQQRRRQLAVVVDRELTGPRGDGAEAGRGLVEAAHDERLGAPLGHAGAQLLAAGVPVAGEHRVDAERGHVLDHPVARRGVAEGDGGGHRRQPRQHQVEERGLVGVVGEAVPHQHPHHRAVLIGEVEAVGVGPQTLAPGGAAVVQVVVAGDRNERRV